MLLFKLSSTWKRHMPPGFEENRTPTSHNFSCIKSCTYKYFCTLHIYFCCCQTIKITQYKSVFFMLKQNHWGNNVVLWRIFSFTALLVSAYLCIYFSFIYLFSFILSYFSLVDRIGPPMKTACYFVKFHWVIFK